MLPTADVAAGKTVSARASSATTFPRAAPTRSVPNLYGVVAAPAPRHPGFSYSGAMKAKGGTWTYDELFKYLKSPGSYVPGTKMSFAGLRSAQDRINLIAFLRTNADSPAAIPAPAPKTAAPAAACRCACRWCCARSARRWRASLLPRAAAAAPAAAAPADAPKK